MNISKLPILLMVALNLIGCTKDLEPYPLTNGYYTVIFSDSETVGYGESKDHSSCKFYSVIHEVAIDHGNLYVDYFHYGNIQTGSVVVVKNGIVLVDDHEISGTKMSKDEILHIASAKKTEASLGGHGVTIIPGVSFLSHKTYTFSSKQELVAGKYTLHLKKSHLTINGEDFGELSPNQNVVINFGEITLTQ